MAPTAVANRRASVSDRTGRPINRATDKTGDGFACTTQGGRLAVCAPMRGPEARNRASDHSGRTPKESLRFLHQSRADAGNSMAIV
jgi:sugar lactone lactonase YvrE